MSWKQYFKREQMFSTSLKWATFFYLNIFSLLLLVVGEAFHLQIVKNQNHYLSFYFQVYVVRRAAWIRFCFLSKIKTISSRLKLQCFKTVNMHWIMIILMVQPLEVVMTYTSQTTQTPLPTRTQILVKHTNFLQATLRTPKFFWLALTSSLHLK